MIVFETLRKINRYVKAKKKRKAGQYLSPVRRIERVYPLQNARLCAMTFDDGPSALPPNPPSQSFMKIDKNDDLNSMGLTEVLMQTLNHFDAVGTFDCVGTTLENYPDERGKINTAKWGGKKHDHYPDFEKDQLAGLLNQLQIGQRLKDQNHEIANHGGHHVIFGPIKLIYDSRESLKNIEHVIEDLTLLHNYTYENLGLSLTLSRPPHYIDRITGGYNAYDAYAMMGYQYMAASYDGGGWKPSVGDYTKDVTLMVEPFQKLLDREPDVLNGHIIFQKDGCNMSLETPIADALYGQLELLKRHQYKVVGVSELIHRSPFEDFGEGHENFEFARLLVNSGYITAYRNNSFQPDRTLTFGELVTMCTPKDLYVVMTTRLGTTKRKDFDYSKWDYEAIEKAKVKLRTTHPYYWNLKFAKVMGYLNSEMDTRDVDDLVTFKTAKAYLNGVYACRTGQQLNPLDSWHMKEDQLIKRHEITPMLCHALELSNT